jgi:uncharacterized OB-fold protein
MSDTAPRDAVSAPYWEGLAEGELRLQRCDRCGTHRHYPQLLCPACHSWDWTAVPVEGRGTVHSWTVVHLTFVPDDPQPVPYALVTVDLPEGVRVLARVAGGDGLRLGRGVQVRPVDEAGRAVLVADLL